VLEACHGDELVAALLDRQREANDRAVDSRVRCDEEHVLGVDDRHIEEFINDGGITFKGRSTEVRHVPVAIQHEVGERDPVGRNESARSAGNFHGERL
jgi:hypothetical protein